MRAGRPSPRPHFRCSISTRRAGRCGKVVTPRRRNSVMSAASSSQERLLFLAIVTAELAHTGVAMLQHRVPSGHDGFQYFTIQYYFLNNAIQAHEVAQWIPYMNQ